MHKVFGIVLLTLLINGSCRKDHAVNEWDDVCSIQSSQWLPLKIGNKWDNHDYSHNDVAYTRTIMDSVMLGTRYYFEMQITGLSATEYYRNDASGNVWKWNAQLNAEELFIPATPVRGQHYRSEWVISPDSTVSLQSCTHDHILVTIDSSMIANGYIEKRYYKKGIGLLYDYYYYGWSAVTGYKFLN
jgi:hypothetical protein